MQKVEERFLGHLANDFPGDYHSVREELRELYTATFDMCENLSPNTRNMLLEAWNDAQPAFSFAVCQTFYPDEWQQPETVRTCYENLYREAAVIDALLHDTSRN